MSNNLPPHSAIAIKKFLEGKYARNHIPGSKTSTLQQWIYVEDNKSGEEFSFSSQQFRLLREAMKFPVPTLKGALFIDGASITLPTNDIFWLLDFNGDMELWRNGIIHAAQTLNLRTADIKGDYLVLSDGTSYLLSDCKIEDPDGLENCAAHLGLAWPVQQDGDKLLRSDGRWYTMEQFQDDFLKYLGTVTKKSLKSKKKK